MLGHEELSNIAEKWRGERFDKCIILYRRSYYSRSVFALWCAVAAQRVRKESEASKYGELCVRIQKQIDETRMRISSVKMQLHIEDHALDQALLQWKQEYLMKQEQWLIELMRGKMEEENVQQMPEMRKEADRSGEH